MATYYGGWIATDDWRAVLEVTVDGSYSSTQAKVTVTGKCQSVYAYSSNWQGTLTSASGGGTNSTTFSCQTNQTVTFKTNTFYVTKGKSAQTLSVRCAVYNPNYGSTSTATGTVTVPAKASYSVTYAANKPGAATGTVANVPSTQTKWHGEALALASTQPTLELYVFRGWNTAADGSGTAWSPGASYTANAALALHAQWELAYSYPSVTGLSVIRSDSSGTASEEGTYARVAFSWSVDASASGNAGKRYVIETRAVGGSTWTAQGTTTLSGTSGTVSVTVGAASGASSFATTSSYVVRVSVTDTHEIGGAECTTAVYATLSQAFVWLTANPNHGIGIGKQATQANLLDVGMPSSFDGLATLLGGIAQTGGPVTLDAAALAAWLSALGVSYGETAVTGGTWLWAKLPGGLAVAEYDDTSNRSVACTTATGSLFYGSVSSIALPFTFSSIPSVSVSASGAGTWYMDASASAVTTSATGTIYFTRGTSATMSAVRLHITVIGRWQ